MAVVCSREGMCTLLHTSTTVSLSESTHSLSVLLSNATSGVRSAYCVGVVRSQMSFCISCCCGTAPLPLLRCSARAGSSGVSLEVGRVRNPPWFVKAESTPGGEQKRHR